MDNFTEAYLDVLLSDYNDHKAFINHVKKNLLPFAENINLNVLCEVNKKLTKKKNIARIFNAIIINQILILDKTKDKEFDKTLLNEIISLLNVCINSLSLKEVICVIRLLVVIFKTKPQIDHTTTSEESNILFSYVKISLGIKCNLPLILDQVVNSLSDDNINKIAFINHLPINKLLFAGIEPAFFWDKIFPKCLKMCLRSNSHEIRAIMKILSFCFVQSSVFLTVKDNLETFSELLSTFIKNSCPHSRSEFLKFLKTGIVKEINSSDLCSIQISITNALLKIITSSQIIRSPEDVKFDSIESFKLLTKVKGLVDMPTKDRLFNVILSGVFDFAGIPNDEKFIISMMTAIDNIDEMANLNDKNFNFLKSCIKDKKISPEISLVLFSKLASLFSRCTLVAKPAFKLVAEAVLADNLATLRKIPAAKLQAKAFEAIAISTFVCALLTKSEIKPFLKKATQLLGLSPEDAYLMKNNLLTDAPDHVYSCLVHLMNNLHQENIPYDPLVVQEIAHVPFSQNSFAIMNLYAKFEADIHPDLLNKIILQVYQRVTVQESSPQIIDTFSSKLFSFLLRIRRLIRSLIKKEAFPRDFLCEIFTYWLLISSSSLLNSHRLLNSGKMISLFKEQGYEHEKILSFLNKVIFDKPLKAITQMDRNFLNLIVTAFPETVAKSVMKESFEKLSDGALNKLTLTDLKILLTSDNHLADQKFLERFQKYSTNWLAPEPPICHYDGYRDYEIPSYCSAEAYGSNTMEQLKTQITKEQIVELKAKLDSESKTRLDLILIEEKAIKAIDVIDAIFSCGNTPKEEICALLMQMDNDAFEILHKHLQNYITSPYLITLYYALGSSILKTFPNEIGGERFSYLWDIIQLISPKRIIVEASIGEKSKFLILKKTLDSNQFLVEMTKRPFDHVLDNFINVSEELVQTTLAMKDPNIFSWSTLVFNYTFPCVLNVLQMSGWFTKSFLTEEKCREIENFVTKMNYLRNQLATKGVIPEKDRLTFSDDQHVNSVPFVFTRRLFNFIKSSFNVILNNMTKENTAKIMPMIPLESIFSMCLNLIEKCNEKISNLETDDLVEEDFDPDLETEESVENKSDLLSVAQSATDLIDYLTKFFTRAQEFGVVTMNDKFLSVLLLGLVSDSEMVRDLTLKIMISMTSYIKNVFQKTSKESEKPVLFSDHLDHDFDLRKVKGKEPEDKTTKADEATKKNKNQKKKDAQAKLLSSSCGEYTISGPTMGPDLYTLPSKWPKVPIQTLLQERLWILRFETNCEISKLANELWTNLEYSSVLEKPADAPDRFYYQEPDKKHPLGKYLLDRTELIKRIIVTSVFYPDSLLEASVNSVSNLLNQAPTDDLQKVLNFLINIYRFLQTREAPIIDGFNRELYAASPDMWRQRGRLAHFFMALGSYNPDVKSHSILPKIQEEALAANYKAEGYWLLNMFQFFVPEGFSDRNSKVSGQMLSCALKVCEFYGLNHMEQLITILESFLSKAPNVAELNRVRQSVIILIGNLGKHLTREDPRLLVIFKRLINGLTFPSNNVQKSIEVCISSMIKNLPEEKISESILHFFKILFSNSTYAERHGAAHGMAGIVKGMGIMSLKNYSIMQDLTKVLEDKSANAKHRESALMTIEKLTLCLGRLFEPYVVKIITSLLMNFGHGQESVRRAAYDCCNAIVSKLSAHGVKLILPALLKALEEDSNWKIKAESARLLSTLANCGPKQLSSSLPQIIPRLLKLMTDSQGNVQQAGREALSEISKVILNPEIKSQLPLIIEALNNPLSDKGPVLKSLADTCFVHVIDTASLALIMPVIKRSFEDRSTEIRMNSAKIFGNLFSLSRKEDLNIYIEEITPCLKHCLLDPVPEVRNVIARALGSMVRGIGESSFNDLMPWLMSTLTSEESSVNRSGAAQGLAEVLGGMGTNRLNNIMPDILKTVTSNDVAPYVRDGCLMLFIYLPVVFREDFSVFIPDIIPVILKGLADETEYLRDTSLKAGQTIVKMFAEKSVNILLPQLEKGLFDHSYRIRYSSIQLLGDLLYKIAGESDPEEDSRVVAEMTEKNILQTLGRNCRDEIFSKLQILRSDPIISVRQSAIHVWKIVVQNTVQMLKQIMPTLLKTILDNLSSENQDLHLISARSLGDILKIGDRILTEILPMMNDNLDTDDVGKKKAVAMSLYEVVKNVPKDQIISYSSRFIEPIKKCLFDRDSSDIRFLGAKSLNHIQYSINVSQLDELFTDMVNRLKDEEIEPVIMDSLKHILKLNSRATLPFILPKLIKPSLNAKAFASLSVVSTKSLGRFVDKILPSLIQTVNLSIKNGSVAEELDHCATILISIEDIIGVRFILNDLCCGIVASVMSLNSTLKCFNSQDYDPELVAGSLQFKLCCIQLLAVYLDKTKTLIDLNANDEAESIIKSEGKTDDDEEEEDDGISEGASSDDDDDDDYGSDEDDDDYSDGEDEGSDKEIAMSSDDEEGPEEDLEVNDIAHSIHQTLSEIYPTLICNLCRLLSMKDVNVLKYTWIALDALFSRWSNGKVTTQISDLRQGIRTAITQVKCQTTLNKQTLNAPCGEILLPGFNSEEYQYSSLIQLFCDSIMQPESDLRESAALALTETLQVTSPLVMKKSVIKIIGPMIRILGERESDIVRAAILNSLCLILNKAGTSVKMFATQIQAIFLKTLGDENRCLRLLAAKGLANLSLHSNKINTLLSDMIQNIVKKLAGNNGLQQSNPYLSYLETTLQAIRLSFENLYSNGAIKMTKEEFANVEQNYKDLLAHFMTVDVTHLDPKFMHIDIQQNFIQTCLPSMIPVSLNIPASHLAFLEFSDVNLASNGLDPDSDDKSMTIPILGSLYGILANVKVTINEGNELDIIFDKFNNHQTSNASQFMLLTCLINSLSYSGHKILLKANQGDRIENLFKFINLCLESKSNIIHDLSYKLIALINALLLKFNKKESEEFETKDITLVNLLNRSIEIFKKNIKSEKHNVRFCVSTCLANLCYHLRLVVKPFSLYDHSLEQNLPWTVVTVEKMLNPIILPIIDLLLIGMKDKASQNRNVIEAGIVYFFRLSISGAQGENSVQAKVMPMLPDSFKTSTQNILNNKRAIVDHLWTPSSYHPNGQMNMLLEYEFTYLK